MNAQPSITSTRSAPSNLVTASFSVTVPDHELIRCIGRGSYGEVWLARNVLGAWRAVKIIHNGGDSRSAFDREFSGLQKFEAVSRSCAGLIHVLQVGMDQNERYFYCVMELADDGCADEPWSADHHHAAAGLLNPDTYQSRTLSLEKRRRGRLPPADCLAVALRLAEALQHLHSRNLLHRDIKPSNIIFIRSEAKLADIGLVAEMSEARSYVGTEGYIPPEGPNSPQADIYSLGKVLYEISTGKDRQDFPEPVTYSSDPEERRLLRELNAIVLKACHPDLAHRYSSAQALHAELTLLHQGKSVRQFRARQIRTRFLAAAAALLVLLALVGLGIERFLDRKISSLQNSGRRLAPRLLGKIPERSPSAPVRLVDLSPHYNAPLSEPWHPGPAEDTLHSLPQGIVHLAGTDFDIRGLIQLSGQEIRAFGSDLYPPATDRIAIAQWVKHLHFLHGSISEMSHGATVGRYQVTFQSGRHTDIPLVFGVNIGPLWQPAEDPGTLPSAELAWQGENPATRERRFQLRLYKFSWANPHPEDEIISLFFTSEMRNAAPFLVAVTADEAEGVPPPALPPPDLLGLLQQHAAEFPALPAGAWQSIHFTNPPVVAGALRYHALRLRTPPGETQDMLWALSTPPNFPGHQWFIIPVTGRMKAGFEDWYHAETSATQAPRTLRFQYLNGKKMQPDTEYLLWFGLDSASPPPLQVLLKFVPAGLNPNRPTDLLDALGLNDPAHPLPSHRHYCLGAMH